MFLYELALELDRKSLDLVEIGAGLGMAGLTPSSVLSADQVATFRAALGVPVPNAASAAPVQPPPFVQLSGPAPVGTNRGAVVVIGAVAAVVILLVAVAAFFLVGRTDDGGQVADANGKAGGRPTAPSSQKIVNALPGREGLSALIGTDASVVWGPDRVKYKEAGTSSEKLGGTCSPVPEPVESTYRDNHLVDAEGDGHGIFSITVRTFATAAEAKAWMAAHTTPEYKTCERLNLRSFLTDEGNTVTEDLYEQRPGVQGGTNDHYAAQYTLPNGQACTSFIDVYANVIDTVGTSIWFNTCRIPFDPAVRDQVAASFLNAIPGPRTAPG